MSIYLCCIARLEGKYIKEFIDYYLGLGIDKIIIADNDHDEDNENLGSILSGYNQVEILDYKNKVGYQMKAYTEMYAKYKDEADWILFCDIDEYLVLEKDKDIKSFLSKYPSDCEAVVCNWKTYGDNDQVYADYSKPIMERFTKPCPNAMSQYNFVDDCHVKSFIKGGLQNVNFYSNPHVSTTPLVTYNSIGQRCNNAPFQPVDHSTAYFAHYTTKSLQEYCEGKLMRGTADRSYDVFLKTYVNRYFRINQPTQEKIDWLTQHGFGGV